MSGNWIIKNAKEGFRPGDRVDVIASWPIDCEVSGKTNGVLLRDVAVVPDGQSRMLPGGKLAFVGESVRYIRSDDIVPINRIIGAGINVRGSLHEAFWILGQLYGCYDIRVLRGGQISINAGNEVMTFTSPGACVEYIIHAILQIEE